HARRTLRRHRSAAPPGCRARLAVPVPAHRVGARTARAATAVLVVVLAAARRGLAPHPPAVEGGGVRAVPRLRRARLRGDRRARRGRGESHGGSGSGPGTTSRRTTYDGRGRGRAVVVPDVRRAPPVDRRLHPLAVVGVRLPRRRGRGGRAVSPRLPPAPGSGASRRGPDTTLGSGRNRRGHGVTTPRPRHRTGRT